MVRKLAGVVFAVSTLHASVVSALGLGEIELQSGLNQPLQAEIVLSNLGDLNQQQIAVKLAGKDDFARAGVERIYFLNDLTFTVQFDGSGNGVIKVSSKNLVREPYLDFVLEARWPEGRLLREYTLLVDLPTFSEAAVAAPTPALTRQAALAATPMKARVPAPAPSAAALPAAAPVSGEIITRKNDTLWGIARRARPAGASMQQAMMAIYRDNPHAFERQNINGLNSGQVLRLPSAEQFNALSKQQAIQAVAMQNAAWKSGSAAPLQASETTVEQDAQPVVAEQSYMKLSNATNSESSSSGASAGVDDSAGESAGESADDATDIEAMRSELVVAQETLDRTSRENAELDSRLDELESQVDTLDKLVALKDSQLAALQSRLEQQSSRETAAVDMNYQSSTAVIATPEEDRPPSVIDRLTSPLALGGVGVLALLGIAGLVIRRRSADDEEPAEAVVNPVVSRPNEPAALVASEAEDTVAENVLEPNVAMPSSEESVAAAQIRAQTGEKSFDPLSEAEIYCSYDRHDEAVAMLQQAITEQPDRSELHLKLLSILADLDRQSEFMQVYAKLAANGDEHSLQLAQQSAAGKTWLDDDTATVTAATETSISDEIDNAELDFDLDFDLDDVESLDNTAQHPALDLDAESLDFDLETDSNTDTGLDLELGIGNDTALDLDLGVDNDSDNDTDTALDLDNLNFDFDLNDSDAADKLDTTALADMLDAGAAGDDDLSEMVDGDEIATKLDLARAYVDMGDVDGARDILEEVLQGGSDVQMQEANELLRDLAS